MLALKFCLWLFQKTLFCLRPPGRLASWLHGPLRVSVPRPCAAQEVHPALHIWMEFTPQSNSITGDLIRTAHVSAGALEKVALPEMRVPGPGVHTSHSQDAFLRSLGRQDLVTSVLRSRRWRPSRGCPACPVSGFSMNQYMEARGRRRMVYDFYTHWLGQVPSKVCEGGGLTTSPYSLIPSRGAWVAKVGAYLPGCDSEGLGTKCSVLVCSSSLHLPPLTLGPSLRSSFPTVTTITYRRIPQPRSSGLEGTVPINVVTSWEQGPTWVPKEG